jgi:predicted permease
MNNLLDIVNLLTTLALPIAMGYGFRLLKIFDQRESETLRKFVIRVGIPFLILKTLYKANIESLGQFFPMAASYVSITVLFTLSAYYLAPLVSPHKIRQNTFAFSLIVGNYAFLGWGVVYSFYGEEALARAVFFTTVFWPTFLLFGFWLVHRMNPGGKDSNLSYRRILLKNGSVPIITAAFSILINFLQIPIPDVLWNLTDKFSTFTIPMILFTIGLNFKMRMPLDKLKVLSAATLYRLVAGFALGFVVLVVVRLIFPMDEISQKVVLIESVMPTATMAVFFTEYIDIDQELMSGIIAFSTLLSLLTLPLWYMAVEMMF